MAKKPTRNALTGALGKGRKIPRRDFLQGALVASATALCGPLLKAYGAAELGAAQDRAGYYPPLLTGMRGSHPGSFESAHALRNQSQPKSARDSGEHYDLVVVGGGISGLSAAYFYRARTSPDARILILENHDDFGGHAKRNEFRPGGRMHLLNGGTLEIQSPRPYSDVAEGLIKALGIDVEALSKKIERPEFYRDLKLGAGVFFDRETFGVDKLVVGAASDPKTRSQYPLPDQARADIGRIESGAIDFMPGLSSPEKKLRLSKMSYQDFLRNVVKVDPATILFYQARTKGWWGVGIDAVSALDCWAIDLPGFAGMNLTPGSISRMGYTARGFADTGGSKTLHFPDGNATIARLLVRSLIKDTLPGSTAEDSVTARVAYDKLDRRDSPIRLRLNSTVIRAQNSGSAGVEVTYVRDGNAQVVRAGGCVLACYNMMIPYLCPEMPAGQKEALHNVIKTPLVYTSVALRNWQAFQKLGMYRAYAPGGYHTYLTLNPKVEVGSYHGSDTPSEPVLVHMVRTPCQAGLPELEQNKVGRAELLSTSFATFEHQIRDQLTRTLSGGGFDPVHDIEAITVNRWPHGYAPEWNPLFAPDIPDAQRPNVLGRAQFGRITIANSDAGAAAYTDSAIDQANRAVNELLRA